MTPLRGSWSRAGPDGSGCGVRRLDVVRLDAQDRRQLARSDVRARRPVDHLRRRAQRDDEEGRVAVERDELPGRDLAVDGEPRAEPHDDEDEDAGQQDLRRVERRLVAGDPVAHLAHGLRLDGIPTQEGLLAADAAQHAQAGDRVGTEPDQRAGLLTLGELAGLERADDEGEAGDEHGHADEDDEPERGRGAEQDERDDDVGHDRTRESRCHVVESADAHGVGADRGDDVARRDGARQGLAGVGRLVADQLGRAEGSLHPVGDGVLVTHRAGQGADHDEADEDAAPQQQRARVAADDALVDGLAHRGGEQRLADEPHDAEGDGDHEGAPLALADPPQVCRRARQVRRAGVGVGQRDHLVHRTFGVDAPHSIFRRCHRPTVRVQADSRSNPLGRMPCGPVASVRPVLVRAVEGVGQLVDLEGLGVDAPVAVGRSTDEVRGHGRGEELGRGEQDEGRDGRPGAQRQGQAGEDEDEAEGLRLGRGVQARQGVGEADEADGPGEAEERAEEQATRRRRRRARRSRS